MDYDLILTSGVALLALSLPSFLGAWAENRLSRSGVFMVALAVGMIGWAVHSRPEAYTFQQLPDVVLGVVGRMIN